MANPPRPKPDPARSVFINCPFDERFRPILRAICFAVISSGYAPRCALDSTDDAEVRVAKIAALIGACDWGIHDLVALSDVARIAERLDAYHLGYVLGPRVNAGGRVGRSDLGARLLGEKRHRRKRALILDAERHRYDSALSDISGQDIECHDNDPDQAMACVRNWLSEHRPHNAPPLPGAGAMQTDYRLFQDEVTPVLARRRLDPDQLTHSDFLWLVRDWIASRAEGSSERP